MNNKGRSLANKSFSVAAKLWSRFIDWGIGTIGSSRSSALIRIGLVFIIWARFAADEELFEHELGWRTVFSILFYVSTVTMLIGYKARISTFIVGILIMTIYNYFGLRLHEMTVSSHMYWLVIAPLLCALAPCDKSYSLDRWLAVRHARERGLTPPPEQGNLWGLRLIVVQLTMMYFWTAVDKVKIDFITGYRLEGIFAFFYVNQIDIANYAFVLVVLSWMVMLLEFALSFCMPFPKTRRYLVIPGLLLHSVFYLLLPVKTYSITIILLYLAYFDANKVHRIIDELNGVAPDRVAFKT